MNDLTIIIPTLNEEKNIDRVVRSCKKYSNRVLVVDDSSTDKTRELAKSAGARVINREGKKRGLTASVLEGIQNTQTRYFIVIDGDGQHPPEKIPEIYEKLKKNDLVVGIRKEVPGWAFHRRAMSKIAELLAKTRLCFKGRNCSDVLSGFFGGKTDYVKEYINKNKNYFVGEGYKVLFDLLKHSRNIKIGEVNYVFQERMGGKSKIGRKQIIAFLKSLMN